MKQPSGVMLHQQFYKSSTRRSLEIAKSKCNVCFSLVSDGNSKMRNDLLERVSASGMGVDVRALDFYTLDDALMSLRNQSADAVRDNVDKLSPYATVIKSMLTERKEEYFNSSKSLLKRGVLSLLTEHIKPTGLLSVEADYAIDSVKWLATSYITNGVASDKYELHLPLNRIIGMSHLDKRCNDMRLGVFIVIGPAPEVWTEQAAMENRRRSTNTVSRTISTSGGTSTTVQDQEYAVMFVITSANTRTRGVLNDAASRCLAMQNSKTVAMYKEVAAIRLGFVSPIVSGTNVKISNACDGEQFVQISKFVLSVEHAWQHRLLYALPTVTMSLMSFSATNPHTSYSESDGDSDSDSDSHSHIHSDNKDEATVEDAAAEKEEEEKKEEAVAAEAMENSSLGGLYAQHNSDTIIRKRTGVLDDVDSHQSAKHTRESTSHSVVINSGATQPPPTQQRHYAFNPPRASYKPAAPKKSALTLTRQTATLRSSSLADPDARSSRSKTHYQEPCSVLSPNTNNDLPSVVDGTDTSGVTLFL